MSELKPQEDDFIKMGACRICGRHEALNQGFCGAESADAAQGYMMGYEEGLKATRPASDVGELVRAMEDIARGPLQGPADFGAYAQRVAKQALASHRSGKGEA